MKTGELPKSQPNKTLTWAPC